MPNLRELGRAAEDAAATYLIGQGYTIVTRRYTARHGEIDLVALDGDLLVFVEVKRRDAPGYVPEESIGAAKRRALAQAGRQYLAEVALEPEREARFDLIAIDRAGLRHHRDIFAV
ncbi:MAG: YraN family protein [Fimbriimonas sp.]